MLSPYFRESDYQRNAEEADALIRMQRNLGKREGRFFYNYMYRAIHDLRPPCGAHPVDVGSKVGNYN